MRSLLRSDADADADASDERPASRSVRSGLRGLRNREPEGSVCCAGAGARSLEGPRRRISRAASWFVLAYRQQARAHGDLDRVMLQVLHAATGQGDPASVSSSIATSLGPRSDLRPGTVLTREYEGVLRRVMVVEFEREVTGERIRDKIAASKRKWPWMGGVVPLGYRVEARKLLVEEPEADLIRRIFSRYLELGSLPALQGELRERGNDLRVNAELSLFEFMLRCIILDIIYEIC